MDSLHNFFAFGKENYSVRRLLPRNPRKKTMAHAIARIAKLKGGSVKRSGAHVTRDGSTPNADMEIVNIRLIGPEENPQLKELVRNRIGDQTIRKNAVECVEILLTASPEYFRPQCPERGGYYEPNKLTDFRQATCDWLQEKYGDRIVLAELHLDEVTPHIHAYLVPLDERGKLNCRGIFGGREKLSEFQDSFADAMKHLGLERGIRGSKANHIPVREYYAAVNQPPDQNLALAEIHQQLADRRIDLKEKEDLKRTLQAVGKERDTLKERIRELESEAKEQRKNAEVWQRKYMGATDKLRDLPLGEVAYELGLEPDPQDPHRWIHPKHMINITGAKFFDWEQGKGGGGAIDLVMHVLDCNFRTSIAWLNDRLGEAVMVNAVTYQAKAIAEQESKPEFVPPTIDMENWPNVRRYLNEEKRISQMLIDKLNEAGLVYADDQKNVIFLRQQLDGSEVTGAMLMDTSSQDNVTHSLVPGSNRSEGYFYFEQGGQSNDKIQKAVLTSSPIDSLSLAVLDGSKAAKVVYIAMDKFDPILVDSLEKIPKVVVACKAEEFSSQMMAQISAQLPQAVRQIPSQKDWNDELKSSFKLDSSLRRSAKIPDKLAAVAGDGAKAYRQHYRQVSEDQWGDNVDLSRIDGEIAMRMRATGHTQAEVEQIIAQCAQALRETAEGRNWDSYGQQVAESAFGTVGDRQMPRLEAQRKQLLELEEGVEVVRERTVERPEQGFSMGR
jgi:Plasmid recombination enzyme